MVALLLAVAAPHRGLQALKEPALLVSRGSVACGGVRRASQQRRRLSQQLMQTMELQMMALHAGDPRLSRL